MKRWRGSREIRKGFYALIFLLFFLAVWEVLTRLKEIEPWLLPSPLGIASALHGSFPLILFHARYTIAAALAGFLAAIIAAVLLALLMDLSPVIRHGLYPILIISQTVPIIFLAPLFFIWFGYGLLPKIAVTFLVCFFPVVIALADGLNGADQEMVNLLRVMGATPRQILWKVRWPMGLPGFFSGLKVAAAYSIMGAVIGEWIGAGQGLGVFMIRSTKSFKTDNVFAAIIVVAALSMIIFLAVEGAARVFMPWKHKGN